MKICVIIPTYNESKEIARLIKEIKEKNPDVLVVDDGSADSTAELAQAAGATVLRNSVNQGKGACLKKGFRYVIENGFDAALVMDGDGQHLPEDLPGFINLAVTSEAGIVVGNRMSYTKNMPFIRIITNRFMSWMISLLCKQKIPDTQCGYRLIKRRALEKIELKTSNFEIETEILLNASRAGFKIASVPIKTVYRGEKSQINPIVDTFRFIKFIIKAGSR
ncbi:MAG: glycosyltransferase family 2 protein [Candidatus Omnitrophota bacterium]|jgi:glycosyltransferase involved in cell wall biosynthesis